MSMLLPVAFVNDAYEPSIKLAKAPAPSLEPAHPEPTSESAMGVE